MHLDCNQELVEDSQCFSLAVVASDDGIRDWYFQKEEIHYCDRWKSVLGFHPHEIGNPLEEWRSRIHSDELEGVTHAAQQHLAGQRL